jgi:hypothetical protein
MRKALHSFLYSPYIPLRERATVVYFEVLSRYSTEKTGRFPKVFLARVANTLVMTGIVIPGTARYTKSFGKPTIVPATSPA